MSKIALIADIHGNIPALSAVEEDIKRRGADKIYCLGDMCGRGPNGSYVIDWCRANCEVIVLGNWDCHIINRAREDYLQEVGEQRREYLTTLPLFHRMWISGRRVHLFHGRPLKPDIIWHDWPDEKKLSLFSLIEDEHPADIIGVADIHRQYKTDFKDDYRFIFNTGSVGNSYCTPTACYAIIDGDIGGRTPAPISVEFVSVPYDNKKACENAVKQKDWFMFVDDYIKEITEGKWQRSL